MALTVRREVVAPLLLVNLFLCVMVMAFSSSILNHYINGEPYHPGVVGNGATFYLVVFAVLAGVVGVASKIAGAYHVRAWRHSGLAAAAFSATVAWAITALAFGVAWKEICIGGERGWRLRVLEVLTTVLSFTQLLYVVLLHAAAAH